MNYIQRIEFGTGSKEELLPNFTSAFPYIASYVELDKHAERSTPWHWHKTVELFYIEGGALEYYTPKGKTLFPAGSGGMINSNVLHMTKAASQTEKNIQLIHIFDTSFIAGEQGSQIEKKYVMPIVTASQIELLALYPDNATQADILKLIRNAFRFTDKKVGYEIELRETLSKIWLMLFDQFHSMLDLDTDRKYSKNGERLKLMMVYIHEHFSDKISIAELAATAFLSERECFRLFRNYLHLTPTEYIRSYRLQKACQMLAQGQEPITAVGRACGLGSGSYFSKIFREHANCTPMEYRKSWQDSDI